MNNINYVKTFGNFLRLEFKFVRERTVASITSSLRSTVEALEAHAAEQIVHAKAKSEAAVKALKERAAHEEEHILASKTAQNIKALLS